MSDLLTATDLDVEGHRLASNVSETTVDEADTEGHRLASNVSETAVEDAEDADPGDTEASAVNRTAVEKA